MDHEFLQEPPKLGNQYDEDGVLREFLRCQMPADLMADVEADYHRLGERAVTDWLVLAQQAEAQPPRHIPYDAWGHRIDRVEVSAAWQALERISAEEGLVAAGYERRFGSLSRLDQMVRLYLFAPSSAIFACPLAMTDGAARAIELYGDATLKAGVLPLLTSRDPADFKTCGQWMTERSGGSDVSSTETEARLVGGEYRLYGTKWFTSSVTSPMAMTLARLPGAPSGSRGLSLFYVPVRPAAYGYEGLKVLRLKEKLGTRALPTAELQLEGISGILVGGEGQGVKKIASLFNITRVYNSVVALSFMRRNLALAGDYARQRKVFGRRLSEQPLHVETLVELQITFEAVFQLVFYLVKLLGLEETQSASPEQRAVLRALTPLAKLYSAKEAVALTSEVLECFGGAGYLEDTGLAVLLRDAQVLTIWEGTTNVLALDLVRALEREKVFPPLMEDIAARLARIRQGALASDVARVRLFLTRLENYRSSEALDGSELLQAGAREMALTLARVMSASLLLEQADLSLERGEVRGALVAHRFCSRELCVLKRADDEHRQISARILQ